MEAAEPFALDASGTNVKTLPACRVAKTYYYVRHISLKFNRTPTHDRGENSEERRSGDPAVYDPERSHIKDKRDHEEQKLALHSMGERTLMP